MSTNNGTALSKKNDPMLSAIALILGLVIGIILYQMTDGGFMVIIYTMLLVFGIYYLATVPFVSNEGDYAPSMRSFRLAWGALLTTLGLLLLINEYSGMDLWVMLVIILVVVILIIAFIFVNKKG